MPEPECEHGFPGGRDCPECANTRHLHFGFGHEHRWQDTGFATVEDCAVSGCRAIRSGGSIRDSRDLARADYDGIADAVWSRHPLTALRKYGLPCNCGHFGGCPDCYRREDQYALKEQITAVIMGDRTWGLSLSVGGAIDSVMDALEQLGYDVIKRQDT